MIPMSDVDALVREIDRDALSVGIQPTPDGAMEMLQSGLLAESAVRFWKEISTKAGVSYPSLETRRRVIQVYRDRGRTAWSRFANPFM